MAKTIKIRQAAEIIGILSVFLGVASCATVPNQPTQSNRATEQSQACATQQEQAAQNGNAEAGKKPECANREIAGIKPTSPGEGDTNQNLPLNPVGRPGSSVGWGRAY